VLLKLREESAGDGARSALAGPQAEANRMHSDKPAGLSRVWRVVAAGRIRPRNSPGAQMGFRGLPRFNPRFPCTLNRFPNFQAWRIGQGNCARTRHVVSPLAAYADLR
jgi:hypothetical protein